LACLVIDIDRLQAHNDAGGREAGDRVVRFVADTIRRSVREVDVVARFGGDEFLVVLPSTHFAGSVTVAERIFQDANQRIAGAEQRSSLPVALSLGVALFPSRDVRTKDALLRGADSALHAAKRDGGNRICVYQQQGHMYTPVSGASSAEDTKAGRPRSDRPYRRSDRPTSAPPPSPTRTPGRKPE
jgi:diguanylate cyclase (GGDEF)-like protein